MTNTRILLINPPETIYKKFFKHNLYFPLGVMYLASMVKDISKVEILNCMLTTKKPQKLGEATLVGIPYENIEKQIKEFKPNIVGISIMFFQQAEGARQVSKICKQINPETKVIFGGPYPSIKYNQFLKENDCDYCVVGEGEETFREIVEKYNENLPIDDIAGVAYKKNNEVFLKRRDFILDLDKLPYPAYDLIDVKEYLNNPHLYKTRSIILNNSMTVITSRGCPFNCVFCSVKLHMGQTYRAHSAEYVINHIKYIINNFGIKNFHFEDDNVSLDRERFVKILEGITPLKIKWDTPNGVRGDTLDYDILKKIKESGNVSLQIAIESGNQDVLNNIVRKNTSLVKLEKVLEMCKKLKIKTTAFYVIGFPGETKDNIKQTLDYAITLLKKYSSSPSLFVANPIYGTDLYKICQEKGYLKANITEKEMAAGSSLNGSHLISTEEFNSDDIDELLGYFKYEFNKYLRYYHLKHPIKSLKTFAFLFKQHPITTVKRSINLFVNRKNKS